MKKLVESADEAVRDVWDGATLMVGGFGLCGNPENLIEALHRKRVKDLVLVSNNCGTTDLGLGILLKARQIRKIVASYVGENKEFERQYLSGELEVELVPQGTLAERIRAGGAGMGGFYTPTGVGTRVAEGKETRTLAGREYLLELPLKADFSLVRARRADPWGNLVFHATTRNFQPMMAAAGKVTIAEAEEIVPLGAIPPDEVHTPGIYVKRVVKGEHYERWVERRTVRSRPEET